MNICYSPAAENVPLAMRCCSPMLQQSFTCESLHGSLVILRSFTSTNYPALLMILRPFASGNLPKSHAVLRPFACDFTSFRPQFYVPSAAPGSLFASASQKLPFSPTICRVFWRQRFYTCRISVVSLAPIFLGKQSFTGEYIASFYSTNILQTCCKFPKILLIFKHQLCKIILNSTQSCCNSPVSCHARWLILIQCLDEQQRCK